MREEYSKTERLAMLVELSLNYHEEANKALDKRDFNKAQKLIKLEFDIEDVIKDIEERG